MKVYELINKIDNDRYADYLRQSGNSEETVDSILSVVNTLKTKTPKECKRPLEILIFKSVKFTEFSSDVVIEGIVRHVPLTRPPKDYKELEEHIERYSFSGTDWGEVLNYKINDNSLEDYSEHFILTTILDEITEMGWTESDISVKMDEIRTALKEAEDDIREGRVVEYIDRRSEEEKARSRLKMHDAMMANMTLYYEYLS